ncbi:MAG: 50S ribosomal protein L18 [Maioricimonas sp. JB049]
MRLEKKIAKQRQRRQFRVRNRVRAIGRPRLTVFRSNKHIYAQIIDDVAGVTLAAASTAEKELGGAGSYQGNCDAATRVGEALAQRAVEKGVKQVAFDRGRYKFHGRVAALAAAARKGGLDF